MCLQRRWSIYLLPVVLVGAVITVAAVVVLVVFFRGMPVLCRGRLTL
jgi:hypothetical protein